MGHLEGDLEILEATNILETRAHFAANVEEKDGKVRGTPLINHLYLKKGARVILIYNVDVCDGLNNGAKGTVVDFVRRDNAIESVIVEFDKESAGKALREKFLNRVPLLNSHKNSAPIPKITFSYNLSRKQSQEGQKVLCIQFPLQLGYAMTIHKVQGFTVPDEETPRPISLKFFRLTVTLFVEG